MIYNMDCIAGAKQHLQDESIDLLIADPPYNLGFFGRKNPKTKKHRFNIIANDHLNPRNYQRFTFQWLREAYRVLKPGRHIYVFIDWRMYPLLYLWMQRVGFVIKNCVIWNKVHMGMGYQYRYQHEFIVFAVKGKSKERRIPNRRITDIWPIPKVAGQRMIHPTEKPVKLMEDIILNSSQEGETVADFFLGSGPTVEAANKLGRKITGFEIDEVYFNLASSRQGLPPL
ncbi:DNA-methyltransferase [Brevibacillus laterosporus]|uniref:DNA-methyltransferase n=1 Tax=Brevibacillus laterosporus TaxID=1465 RepID=UPI00036AC1A8|nr:site-specific DNA-methyltransferase [Brevibacillus laterosporus]ATO48393.1 site-specific DNA-methyltransferase [Brevibacillus laterosporus DSM 25]MBG9789711.1 adenine methyltransferase [Brevibacillus laterosporus]MBG9803171.1 adenine methyltransferase [Brevibacillus laterosporus]MED2002142.1 site-specific DNA-methyltransferase [Brevibacillus laterosporus]MED4765482.1 site-specific DNA-methyltransferase [Brevibacillus laterosporus]